MEFFTHKIHICKYCFSKMSTLPAIIENPKSVERLNNEKNHFTPGSAIIFDLVSNGHVSKLPKRN